MSERCFDRRHNAAPRRYVALRACAWRLLCLLACLWCATATTRADLVEAGPEHHFAYNFSGTSITINFMVNAAPRDVTDFTIYVDGVGYPAARSDLGYGQTTGSVTRPVPNNPHEFQTYAIAVTRYGGSGTPIVHDSRNQKYRTPDYNGPLGSGHRTCFILANIKFKGLTWENRPGTGQIYETGPKKAYPNATDPYHLKFAADGTSSPQLAHAAVYIKGMAPSLKMELQPQTGAVPVRASVTNFNLSVATPGYPFNTKANFTGNTTTILCPPLKNEVNNLNASFNSSFECQFQDGYWTGLYSGRVTDVSGLPLYAVYAQPTFRSDQAPEIPTDVPWEVILEQACGWAAGKSTYLDVAEHLTKGLFFSKTFKYDTLNGESRFTDDTTPIRQVFMLTDFFTRSAPRLANCVDISDYHCICANMLGLGFQVSAHLSNPGPRFMSNRVCLISQDPTQDSSYEARLWTFHQFARSYSMTVYDACSAQKLNLSGAQYRNPPCNWPLQGFWQTLTTSPSVGLVNYASTDEGKLVQVQSQPKDFEQLPGASWTLPSQAYIPLAY